MYAVEHRAVYAVEHRAVYAVEHRAVYAVDGVGVAISKPHLSIINSNQDLTGEAEAGREEEDQGGATLIKFGIKAYLSAVKKSSHMPALLSAAWMMVFHGKMAIMLQSKYNCLPKSSGYTVRATYGTCMATLEDQLKVLNTNFHSS